MKTFPHSTNVVSVDHNAATMTLTVVFKGGATYEYAGVPEHVYKGICESKSPGSFLRQFVIIRKAADGSDAHPATKVKA